MKGHKVAVEANVRVDREQFVIIGLPDASIKESKERVLSCLHAMNIEWDMKKITIHLSPSDIRKSGTGLMQFERFGKEWSNGFVPFQLVDETSGLSNLQKDFIQQICFEKKWSNRAQTKLIRIARTIADLEGSKNISEDALQESIKWKSMASELQISSITEGG